MSFSENLRDVLDFRGIQVKELSAKTEISKNTIDNYLSGQKSLPNIENGVKIAQALGVSAEYLVTGKVSDFDSLKLKQQNSDFPIKPHPKDEEISEMLKSIKRLKKSDFDSIRQIIKSLAGK